LAGYSAPPNFSVATSDSNLPEDESTAYALFFLDPDNSAEIVSRGMGLVDFSANAGDVFRISGKGFRPEQFYRQQASTFESLLGNWNFDSELFGSGINFTMSDLDGLYNSVMTSDREEWFRNNRILENGDRGNIAPLTNLGTRTLHRFGEMEEHIFVDWNQNDAVGEPRNVNISFSDYISSIEVTNAGYGYSVPLEVKAVGGYPTVDIIQQHVANTNTSYDFVPAELKVHSINQATGSIIDVEIVDSGLGYAIEPRIVFSGGGGSGAIAQATLDELTGGISDVTIINGGRGYFNLNSTAEMSWSFDPPLAATDEDANMTPILGGYLSPLDICPCIEHEENTNERRHAHLDPWIEIWDRERNESIIDQQGDRAFAAAKVRNGIIEKVVVINSGRGYVDPVIYVRGSPPNRFTSSSPYILNPSHFFSWDYSKGWRIREWQCTNLRETTTGSIVECPNSVAGNYPPEFCPHNEEQFLSRCTGTKTNYVLANDPYRTPYAQWEPFDAKLTAIVENGKIMEIKVVDGGQMYAASDIQISGSGGHVDIIPIYDEDGFNIDIIYDDPELKNLERDGRKRPLGAGQGFVERPWSWDATYDPTHGFREKPTITHYLSIVPEEFNFEHISIFEASESDYYADEAEGDDPMIFYGEPVLENSLGDRVVDIRINNSGIFSDPTTTISATIDFNGTHRPDINRDGSPDFVDAEIEISTTLGISEFLLDENGTFLETFDVDNDGNDDSRWRSLYLEQPEVNAVPQINGITTNINETESGFFRLNGLVGYSASDPSFDLYIDNRTPNSFFYGLETGVADNTSGMGGKITIVDNNPDQLISEGSKYVYTDQNGFYSLSGLNPGLYTVNVYLEDEEFQESTFRPDSNTTHVTQVIYVPGFPKLTMESDQSGEGISRMVWSKPAKLLSRPNFAMTSERESVYEQKILEGIGAGFRPNTTPQLSIIPHKENTTLGIPKLDVEVLVDGSLKLTILDDIFTNSFDLKDRFDVIYSSNISGVDFREDYLYSQTDSAGWLGTTSSYGFGVDRLSIFPNDGNGTNSIEVPISSTLTGPQPFTFKARIYDENGTEQNASMVSWEIDTEFTAKEDNNTKVASLNGSNQFTGDSVDILLHSTLRRGKVESVKIDAPGSNYSIGSTVKLFGSGIDFNATIDDVDGNGGILSVNIVEGGSGYASDSFFEIDDPAGSDAILKPILGGGEMKLNATAGTLTATVRIYASQRTQLTREENWLNLYFDTIEERNATWWGSDIDADGLTNLEEFTIGSHPEKADTDGDGMSDSAEINASALYQTNPLSRDTDGDGLMDGNESVLGTNPLLADTDGDGVGDYDEFLDQELDPLSKDLLLVLSGVMYQEIIYPGDLYLKLERGSIDDSNNLSKPIQIYENNESFVRQSNTNFPRAFQFTGLLSNRYYRLSGFIDLNGNQVFDSGEIYIEWEGLLETNKVDLQILFKDLQPDLNFLDQYEDIIEIAKGESFQLSLLATDYPDYNWTGPLVVDVHAATPSVLPSIVVSGDATEVLAISNNQAVALNSANYGTYSLEFTAFDVLGTASVPLERQIIITDKQDPVISVQSNPYPWPLGTPWDPTGIFSANDDPDGNITSKVVVTGNVDSQTIGQYPISLFVRDAFGRTTTEFVTVDVADLSPPTIHFFEGDSSISWLLGAPFILPENYVTVTDNVDADLTTQLEIFGLDLLNETEESNQTIYFAAEDSAGNRVENKALTISFQQPAWSIAGVAIDGYLSGSVVSFVPSNPALNYLSITGTTNITGGFDLFFLEEDFSKIDTNGNQMIDPSEGTIVVTGGIDTNTNQPFNSALSADANSSVVSPLTTILSEMIKNGTPKGDAQTELAKTFGYTNTIDITTYDPIAEAKTGDSDTVAILQANALVVNTFKQVAAIADHMNSEAESIEVSSQIAKSLAKMVNDETSLMDELQKIDVLKEITENTFRVVDPDFEFNEVQLESFSSVIQNTNQLLAINSMENLSAGEALKKLSQKQIAVEQEVIEGFAQLNQGLIDLDELKNISDVETLDDLSQQINSVNNFAPEGENFEKAFGKSDFELGEILYQLSVTDADGDAVVVSFLDSNEEFDLDGDKLQPFGVNAQNQLIAIDVSDVETLFKERNTVTIIFELTDNNGKTGTMQGVLTKEDNFNHIANESANQRSNERNYDILDAVLDSRTSWYSSDWFGDFYPGKDGWLYHYTLGWIYLQPSEENGFWIWDSHYDAWWWSSKDKNVFPYFYLFGNDIKNSGWGKLENLDSETRVFEYFNQSWTKR
jgi:hypothetical protein